MLKIARDCDLHIVEDLFYSRQNFLFPNQQLSPHSSFDSEISYLHQEFRNGAAFTLGRINGSHYNVFNAEARIKREDKRKEADASVEIMMSGLDQDIMQKHFHKHSFNDQTLHESGIGGLFEGATIDEFAFEPCGYSMNGILGEMVFTIHVTPEVEHSYASFECNAHMGDYTELLHKVLRIFNPSQFMVVTCGKNVSGNKDPSRSAFSQEGVAGYLMQDEALTNFENYKLKYNYFVALSPETEADREEPLIF
jgi:S-adenosylmethionine decarboxylase